jgi:hypothetical protein
VLVFLATEQKPCIFRDKPKHRQLRRRITLQCILIGKTSWSLSRRFPWDIDIGEPDIEVACVRVENKNIAVLFHLYFVTKNGVNCHLDIVNFGAKLPYNVF